MLTKRYNEFKKNNGLSEVDGKIITSSKVELRLSLSGKSIELIKYIDGNKFGGQILEDEQNEQIMYLTPENKKGEFFYEETIEKLIEDFLSL